MNTRIFRFDLATASDDLAADLVKLCDAQFADSFRLASTFTWETNLVLIFQRV